MLFLLTEMIFILKAKDKYDLKSKVKVYPKFFINLCYKTNGDLLRKV